MLCWRAAVRSACPRFRWGLTRTRHRRRRSSRRRPASHANLASLSEAVQRNPADPQAYNTRGTALAQAGRTQEALADFDKALSLDPNYAQALANRGLVYRQTRKLDQALADYNRAIEIDANYAPAYLGRGLVYKARRQLLQALEDFNKSIALKADNPQAYYNRGLLYQSQKQHQFAIDDFTVAARPVRAAGRAAGRPRAELSRRRQEQGGRHATSTRPCNSQPDSVQAWTTRGLAYERLGDNNKAAGSYARALTLKKEDEAAKVGFARVGGKPGQRYDTF